MAQPTNATLEIRDLLLVLAVATAVTGFSASTIRDGIPRVERHVAMAESAPVEPPRLAPLGAAEASLASGDEPAIRDARFALIPPLTREPPRERFIGEGEGQAHVGTLSSTRGSDHSDLRVFLLEATAQLRVRDGRLVDRAPEAHVMGQMDAN